MDLKTFYVTFGIGTLFGHYYATIEAFDRDVVHAFMNKHYRGVWSDSYDEPPLGLKPLQGRPLQLYYSAADHV